MAVVDVDSALLLWPQTFGPVVGLAWSSAAVEFVTFDGSTITRRLGEVPNPTWYEVRLFNETASLTWFRDGRDQRATILSDREFTDAAAIETVGRIDVDQLCWGAVIETDDGWSRLAERQIGSIWVPLSMEAEQRARIRSVEYVDCDEHGNTYVIVDRPVALEVADG